MSGNFLDEFAGLRNTIEQFSRVSDQALTLELLNPKKREEAARNLEFIRKTRVDLESAVRDLKVFEDRVGAAIERVRKAMT